MPRYSLFPIFGPAAMIAFAAAPPAALDDFALSLPQQRYIAALATQANVLLARTLLIGAVPGQAPSVLQVLHCVMW
jgi:hypothetical protein